jgi:tRNA (guanine9-N1)-methyltransferase
MAIVIDASFDSLMTDAEIVSLGGQLTRSYTAVRLGTAAAFRDGQPERPTDDAPEGGRPLFVVAGFDGRLREHMEVTCHAQHKGWKGVRVLEDSSLEDGIQAARAWLDEVAAGPDRERAAWPLPADDDAEPALPANEAAAAAEQEAAAPAGPDAPDDPTHASTVYLTPESPNLLTALRPSTTYVVGGLVDRNRHKGACHARARALGLATARLPLAEHVRMPRHNKTVMATSHVVALMVRWLARGGEWERSILDVVPARTGVVGRSGLVKGGGEEGGEADGGAEERGTEERGTEERDVAEEAVRADEQDSDES